MAISRRSFLSGVSAAALGAVAPVQLARFASIDSAWSPAIAARWLVISNPTGPNWLADRFIYGNDDWAPVEFSGFVPRWDTGPSFGELVSDTLDQYGDEVRQRRLLPSPLLIHLHESDGEV